MALRRLCATGADLSLQPPQLRAGSHALVGPDIRGHLVCHHGAGCLGLRLPRGCRPRGGEWWAGPGTERTPRASPPRRSCAPPLTYPTLATAGENIPPATPDVALARRITPCARCAEP